MVERVENDGMSVRDRGSLKTQWAALPWGVRRSISRDLIKGRAVADPALRDVAAWRAHRVAVTATVAAVAYTVLFLVSTTLDVLHVVRPHRSLPLRLLGWIVLLSWLWWSARRYRRAEMLNAVENGRSGGSG